MKKIRNIIIILIIIIVLIITALILLNKKKNNNSISEENIVENQDNGQEDIIYDSYENGADQTIIDQNIKVVTNSTKFYTVSNCVQNYMNMVTAKNKISTYNMLSKKYINSNKIEQDNVLKYTANVSNNYTFTPLKMNVLEGVNTDKYAVYGKILEKEKIGIGKDIFFIVEICTKNITFSITPLNNYTSINQIKLENEDIEIVENDDNIFSYYRITDEELIRKYSSNYKLNAIYNVSYAYNLLDLEYRNKRFGSLEEYKKYVSDNKTIIEGSLLKNYKVTDYDNYTKYDYIDQNGRHFIFKETAVMRYTLLLDNYTIETEEYKKEYAEASNEGKVNKNISKFIKMLNNEDYKQSYEALNSTFKSNKFNTQDKFKSYIKSKVFDVNKVESVNYETSGNNHISEIRLLDATGKSEDTVTMIIIMQLKEDTDFEMSFSFK